MMNEYEHGLQIRKQNRRQARERATTRPIVHGALPYLGHRPRTKDEQRRRSELIRDARNRR